MEKRDVSVFDIIHLPLFKIPLKKMATKAELVISSAKKNVRGFSDMYVACQVRKGDTDTFVSLVSPMEKSSGNTYRLESLQSLELVTDTVAQITAHVIDGPAMVHFLLPGAAKTLCPRKIKIL